MPTNAQIQKELGRLDMQLERVLSLQILILRLQGLTLEEIADLEQSRDDEAKLAGVAEKLRAKTQALAQALASAAK